ncbi:glycosyltransferase [Candidatus Saccharibacteria bacterium]|nr:glycosyltransferase [Candidatus Saccharibacteria bacterium]
MLKDITFYAFVVIALINTIHFGLYIAGANIYDVKQIWRKRHLPKAKRGKHPLVTILIPAHNEESGIIKTLESVRKSSYRKLQILVVDDASTDTTRSLVWRYMKDHPHLNIRLLRKQKNVGKGEAMNHALKKYAEGDLLMTIDADSEIAKNSIKNAVRYFEEDPEIVGLAANVQVKENGTMLGLLQKFEHMIGYRSKKFYTLTNSEFIIGGVASTYRMDVVKRAKFYDTDTQTEDIGLSMKLVSKGNLHQRIIYASDVLALTEGVQTYKALFKQRYRWKLGMLQNIIKYGKMIGNNDQIYSRMLTLYRLPMAIFSELVLLVEPILLMYIIYLSIVKDSPLTMLGAYLTITLYVLWTIWPDEHTKTKDKFRLSLYSPIMYFVFYIMNIVQLVAIIRCLKDNKKMLRKVKTGGAWVSPKRATASN